MALLESLQADAREIGQRVADRRRGCKRRIAADPQRSSAALTNLIDNAVKLRRRATIDRRRDRRPSSTIAVLDEGPGIPEAELERVFEPFYRLEASRNRETGGIGLGLTIARNIAHAHGGELKLRNRAGGGLEAVLTLPRRA